jgi:hypothetical protein
MRLSGRTLAAHAVLLQRHVLAHNLANLIRTLGVVDPIWDHFFRCLPATLLEIIRCRNGQDRRQ